MEIKLDDMNNPYTNFLDSIRNKETRRGYQSNLKSFLELIPHKIFEEQIGYTPNYNVQDASNAFLELARKNSNTAKSIIKSYIKELNKAVDKGELSPNTVPNKIKPIKALLAVNDVDMSWSMINKMFPRGKKSDDRAYTRKEIQSMLEHTTLTDKVIILLFSSGGFRLEAWDYFCWNDLIFFDGENGFKGAALRVYHGDPEEYWTFVTPEACNALSLYREEWRSRFLRYPAKDEPLLVSTRYDFPHRLRQKGVKSRVDKLVTKIGLRNSLKKGERRYEVKLDHGFRKYFNTMMRRAKVNYLDKEDMMGHKVGLEKHYERYCEEDFERFSEYQKAIPFLTIDDAERHRLELEKIKLEKSKLENTHIPRSELVELIQAELKKQSRESMFS